MAKGQKGFNLTVETSKTKLTEADRKKIARMGFGQDPNDETVFRFPGATLKQLQKIRYRLRREMGLAVASKRIRDEIILVKKDENEFKDFIATKLHPEIRSLIEEIVIAEFKLFAQEMKKAPLQLVKGTK
jgi:hypothetical protein